MASTAPELKVVQITTLTKLRERAQAVEQAAREAEAQAVIAKDQAEGIWSAVEEIGAAEDWKARFEEMVVAVQDHERHYPLGAMYDEHDNALYRVASRMLEGIGEDLHPEVRRS